MAHGINVGKICLLLFVATVGAAILSGCGQAFRTSEAHRLESSPTPTDPILLEAVKQNDLATARNRLALGGNANTVNDQGYPLLCIAVIKGSIPMMDLLYEFKADPNVATRSGVSGPLELAVGFRRDEAVIWLLARGARVDSPTESGSTLNISVAAGFYAITDHLLAAGADPNVPEKNGKTPLIKAMKYDTSMTEALLSHGANPNIYDDKGWSPLLDAVERNDARKVKLLLEHGADVHHGDRDGWTAYDQALLQGCPEIVAELEKAGATH